MPIFTNFIVISIFNLSNFNFHYFLVLRFSDFPFSRFCNFRFTDFLFTIIISFSIRCAQHGCHGQYFASLHITRKLALILQLKFPLASIAPEYLNTLSSSKNSQTDMPPRCASTALLSAQTKLTLFMRLKFRLTSLAP